MGSGATVGFFLYAMKRKGKCFSLLWLTCVFAVRWKMLNVVLIGKQ